MPSTANQNRAFGQLSSQVTSPARIVLMPKSQNCHAMPIMTISMTSAAIVSITRPAVAR